MGSRQSSPGQARPTKSSQAGFLIDSRIVEIAPTKTPGKVALYRLWIINPDRKEILRGGRNRTTIDSFRLVRARGSTLSRNGNALQSEAASSIGSGISVVGKIIGHGALTIYGHVEGEVRAPTIVIAEGAQIEGKVSAEELTIGGYVKGTIDANRVELNSTAVVKGDIFHRTLVIGGSDAGMKSARAIVRWNR